jgi:hypothetical protein
MLLFDVVKHGDVVRDSDLRPADFVAGVSVGVGRPLAWLMTLPEVSARGLRFKLAGRGRVANVFVAAKVGGIGAGVVGSGTAAVSEKTSMACPSCPLAFSSSSSSSSSTNV